MLQASLQGRTSPGIKMMSSEISLCLLTLLPFASAPFQGQLSLVLHFVTQLCLTLCDSIECSPTRLPCPCNSPGKNTGVGCYSFIQGNLPNPGVEPRFPTLQADSLLSEPAGKPQLSFSDNELATSNTKFIFHTAYHLQLKRTPLKSLQNTCTAFDSVG